MTCAYLLSPKMENCGQRFPLSSLSSLGVKSVSLLEKNDFPPTKLSLSHSRDVAILSLLYCYFHEKGSDELHSLVASGQTFPARTRHATYMIVNHSHFLRILSAKNKFYSISFFLRTPAAQWNRLSIGCVPCPSRELSYLSPLSL